MGRQKILASCQHHHSELPLLLLLPSTNARVAAIVGIAEKTSVP